jgi:hypothetical protein
MLRWGHGSQYGAAPTGLAKPNNKTGRFEVGYGAVRTAHTAGVQQHLNTRLQTGFRPEDFVDDYGLVKMLRYSKADDWVKHLRVYGPTVVSGHIGAVRMFPVQRAGHYVLVIGVTTDNGIAYLDPLRPRSANENKPSVLSEAKFAHLTGKNYMVFMARKAALVGMGGHR